MLIIDKKGKRIKMITLEGKGVYELSVYVYNPANGNTGLDKVTFTAK